MSLYRMTSRYTTIREIAAWSMRRRRRQNTKNACASVVMREVHAITWFDIDRLALIYLIVIIKI